jgi:hypothetical protein
VADKGANKMKFEDDFQIFMKHQGLGEDEDTAWSNLRERFAMSSRPQRIEFIRKVDDYLDVPTPTKEVADIWAKKRDLVARDAALAKIGK